MVCLNSAPWPHVRLALAKQIPLMGALSRSYGRQADPLNLTPVSQWIVLMIPVILLILVLLLSYRLGLRARIRLLEAARHPMSQSVALDMHVAEQPVRSDPFRIFTPEIRYWSDRIARWSDEHDLPPVLVAIVMQIESCGAADVVSGAGAIGLFQVMPFHFSRGEIASDPEVNAARGLDYLARAYELAGGSITATLAGYNGGHSTIDANPNTWPEETRRYVAWGTGIWEDTLTEGDHSETLDRWLAAGGSSLCLQAQESILSP
ncbi:MAG: hypothetical protein E4G99_02815 [Anaerolineales bacterium]|nr:MAG: hypothetical protein E4G99_02815 [Anaerolineales bacterium]